jgi:hypothetical protein
MSHVAVIITSQRCGHCRNMRGSGRLLSKNEISRDKKQPNIPGGYHYDAKFMKKLITADMPPTNGVDTGKLRVINIHYKTFNLSEGVMDISVFTLEPDGNTIRQTFIYEKDGKSFVDIYTIGDSGQVVSSQEVPTGWSELTKRYTPVNMNLYAFFFPILIFFEGNAWTEGMKNGTPLYGYVNGFETKTEAPYGAKPGANPDVIEFPKFLNQFFTGKKELLGKPRGEPKVETKVEPEPVKPEPEPVKVEPKTVQEVKVIPTAGSKKFNFRLYVVE